MSKLIAFLLIFSINLHAQDYGTYPTIEKDKLKRDLELLRQGLEKFHSGMYWYTSKDSVDDAFNKANVSLDTDMNVLQFHKIIAPLVSLSREDHTDIRLPEKLKSQIRSEAKFMPLLVTFLGDDLYCRKNGSNQELDIVGKKILSINGLSPLELVNQIGQLFASDGYIKEVKKSDLGDFQFALHHYYYFGHLPSYHIRFEEDKIELKALQIDEITKNIASREENSASPPTKTDCLEFKVLADSIAYLGIHDFDNQAIKDNKTHTNYKRFLANSFETINRLAIDHLILDLSKNGGGSEGNENLLYSYLGKKYQKYTKVRAKTQRAILDNKVDKPIILKTFGPIERWVYNKRMKDGSYERKQKPGIGLMSHKKEPKSKFKDHLYVLVSPITYSGASEISNMLYSNEIGIFIGQETGGGYYGNTSGYSQTLTLPHSGISIKIPALQFKMNVKPLLPLGRGVIPHHEVVPTFAQHAEGQNASLTYTLKLISDEMD